MGGRGVGGGERRRGEEVRETMAHLDCWGALGQYEVIKRCCECVQGCRGVQRGGYGIEVGEEGVEGGERLSTDCT